MVTSMLFSSISSLLDMAVDVYGTHGQIANQLGKIGAANNSPRDGSVFWCKMGSVSLSAVQSQLHS
jgi:hypothetical protein